MESSPVFALSVSAGEPRFSVGSQEAEGKPRRSPLHPGQRPKSGTPIGFLTFRYDLGLDRTGKYLEVWRSDFALSALHFPVGGDRFRLGLEDFLQFLVSECGVRAKPGWESTLCDGRLRWRAFQAKAVARDFQHEVAGSLRDCGWQVVPPLTMPNLNPTGDQTAW